MQETNKLKSITEQSAGEFAVFCTSGSGLLRSFSNNRLLAAWAINFLSRCSRRCDTWKKRAENQVKHEVTHGA